MKNKEKEKEESELYYVINVIVKKGAHVTINQSGNPTPPPKPPGNP